MSTPEQFHCNRCDRDFSSRQGLLMHQKRVHDTKTRDSWGKKAPSPAPLDVDVLIRTVYPNGIPPKGGTVVRLGAWLEEAEELSKLRS